ncbi:hypothetical protein BDV18DRAFT_139983 [Aspergillus unguis]
MKKIGLSKLFVARFSQKQVVSPIATRYFGAQSNPITPKISHLCRTRDRNTLWWRVSLREMLQHKRVVRSWCARRVRYAFGQELEARGFDKHGRRLKLEDAPKPATNLGFSGNITGSLNLEIGSDCISGTMAALRKEVKVLMDFLIREQQSMQIKQQKQQQHLARTQQPDKKQQQAARPSDQGGYTRGKLGTKGRLFAARG